MLHDCFGGSSVCHRKARRCATALVSVDASREQVTLSHKQIQGVGVDVIGAPKRKRVAHRKISWEQSELHAVEVRAIATEMQGRPFCHLFTNACGMLPPPAVF